MENIIDFLIKEGYISSNENDKSTVKEVIDSWIDSFTGITQFVHIELISETEVQLKIWVFNSFKRFLNKNTHSSLFLKSLGSPSDNEHFIDLLMFYFATNHRIGWSDGIGAKNIGKFAIIATSILSKTEGQKVSIFRSFKKAIEFKIRRPNYIHSIYSIRNRNSTIKVSLGSTPASELSDILSDLSIIYRKMGGSGLDFSMNGVKMEEEVSS